MKISNKLFLVIFISIITIIGLGVLSYSRVKQISNKFDELVELPIPSILRLSNMTESFILSVEEAHSYRLYGNTESKEAYYANAKEFNRLMAELKKELHYGTPQIPKEDIVLIDSISKEVDVLNTAIVSDFYKFEQTKGTDKNEIDPFSGQKDKIVALLRQYREQEKTEIEAARIEVDNTTNETIYIILLAGLIILAVNLIINGLIAKSIIGPLHLLAETAKQLGQGDLSKRVALSGKDELGALADSFNTMADNVQQTHASLEAKIAERTVELENKLTEIERKNTLMIGREVKMAELKKENQELKNKLGGM